MNIKCTQNIYKSANGVSNVAYYILVPEEAEVRGIVQISHGMCEYFFPLHAVRQISVQPGLYRVRQRPYRPRRVGRP